MIRRVALLTALLTSLLTDVAWADVIPPDMHHVKHLVLVEGMDAHQGTTFVAFPVTGDGDARVLEEGKIQFFTMGEPRIYAFQGEYTGPDAGHSGAEQAFFAHADRVKSAVTMSTTTFVDVDDPRVQIHTLYTIERIEGTEILVSKREWGLDSLGHVLATTIEIAPGVDEPRVPKHVPKGVDPAAVTKPVEGPADDTEESSARGSQVAGCALAPSLSWPLWGLSGLALFGLVLLGLRRR